MNSMAHVLKCLRYDMKGSQCTKLVSLRGFCFKGAKTCFTHQLHGGRHTRGLCTSRVPLAAPSQNSAHFQQNQGQIIENLHQGYEDQSQFNFKSSKFRNLLFALGGVLLGGFVFRGQTLLAEEAQEEKLSEEDSVGLDGDKISLEEATAIARDLVQRIKYTIDIDVMTTWDQVHNIELPVEDETGSPGLVVAVSVDGNTVYKEGLGYSDVENRVKCSPDSIFRIASISKSITMAAVAKLWEEGKLDLDKPVQHYVPEFPEKTWKGEKVTITTRQLLCHMAGIRHYDKKYMEKDKAEGKDKTGKGSSQEKDEYKMAEYYIMDNYKSVIGSLNLFKDDPLINKPGTEFVYTTHGWTLVSAVVERASKTPFTSSVQALLRQMKMDDTFPEYQNKLIYRRGRHYVKNKNGRLENAPYTDLSYKWAGGGYVSSVQDLMKFGNLMLFCYQCPSAKFIKQETVKAMWTKVDKTKLNWGGLAGGGYGLGWAVWDTEQEYGFCRERCHVVSHTGGAVGASSVLLIKPKDEEIQEGDSPKGVVVSIIVNMTSVGLNKTAFDIARVFERVQKY